MLLFLVFLKYTKKLKFAALLKDFFNFVPRGTNVNNFFVRKIYDYKAKTKKVHKKFTFFSGGGIYKLVTVYYNYNVNNNKRYMEAVLQ